MVKQENAHLFAFFTDFVSTLVKGKRHDVYHLIDAELVHRIQFVLRLEKNDPVILFDAQSHVNATLLEYKGRKSIAFRIDEIHQNKIIEPTIQWVLPVLKREAFEEALYSLCELGVSTIQPIATQKTARTWGAEKDLLRSKKIMIAAAEQAKNFRIPTLLPAMSFDQWLSKIQSDSSSKLFFDPNGMTLKESLYQLSLKKPENIIACAGPEGDLTYDEKNKLREAGFSFCRLTPTVLRAQQAIAVALGSLRSYLQ